MQLTDTYVGTFVLSNPTTGAAVDADSLPTAVAFKNGVADAISLVVAKISTGHYKVTSAATFTASGFELEDKLEILVTATISSNVTKIIVDSMVFQARVMTHQSSKSRNGFGF